MVHTVNQAVPAARLAETAFASINLAASMFATKQLQTAAIAKSTMTITMMPTTAFLAAAVDALPK